MDSATDVVSVESRTSRSERARGLGSSSTPTVRPARSCCGTQQRGGAVGMKPDADDRDASRRPQRQLTGELSRDEHSRLPLDEAVRVHALERVAEMHDQFRTAVRQHRLNRSVEIARVAVEPPHATDGRRELRRRGGFGIFHGARRR